MIGLLFLLRQDLAMKPGLNYLYMPTFWVLGIHACTIILSNNDNTMRLRNNHYLSLSPSLFLSVCSLFFPVKKKVWRKPSASLAQSWVFWHLDLGCLASRTMRNECLLFEHPIQGTLLKQLLWLRYYFSKINTIVHTCIFHSYSYP